LLRWRSICGSHLRFDSEALHSGAGLPNQCVKATGSRPCFPHSSELGAREPAPYADRWAAHQIFVETRIFSRQRQDHLSDEQFRTLQSHLLEMPETGARIPGTGGLRKLRWSAEGRGKRGGVRIIYFFVEQRELILLLLVYPKNVQDDLTAEQKRVLKELVRAELEQER
jgi:mRNA-degrading endonuclease RelE of RelBE toxin-antitoxin system